MKKKFIFCITLIAVFFFLGRELNPLDTHLFSFHDNTQGARMQEFALNLKNGIIPPRLAPNFSFQHGFPVFNFYAPFTYWVGGVLQLVGLTSALSLKIVLFLGLLVSFIGFFLFASLFFGFWGGLLGASVYSSSLWMAVEIFVRGNVGEIWFMALFPLALYLLKKSDIEKKSSFFFISTIVLSFLFTVHNVLSLVSVVCVILFALVLQNKKKAFLSIGLGLLLASYFLVPALLESKLTYANEIASRTKYSDHFLCMWQLWRAENWSFGGSGTGCLNDDMSFQIGKIHLLLASFGVGIFLAQFMKEKKKRGFYLPLGVLCLMLFFTFLTIYPSQPFWDLFAPIMSVFQFPWRFLPFVVFGTAYFASYVVRLLKNERINGLLAIVLLLAVLYTSSKFFFRPWKYTFNEYASMFLSGKYIQQKAAYQIPEYFPRSGNYDAWRTYDTSEVGFYLNPLKYKVNGPFYKEILADQGQITIPVHYFPFWEIRINGIRKTPTKFDTLGRPILSNLPPQSTIVVRYNETLVEKVGNGITVLFFIVLIYLCVNKRIWKKLNNTQR